ncbi:MAG: ATP-dependent Clp protease adaptor ClpS [Lysobacterales bacterium]
MASPTDNDQTLLEELRAETQDRVTLMLSRLLERTEIVELIGPMPSALLAELKNPDLLSPGVEAVVMNLLNSRPGAEANDARFLLTVIFRGAPEVLTRAFARHEVSAPNLVDLITHGSPRPAPPDPASFGDGEVLLEALNDNYTPADAVVRLLMSACGLELYDAIQLTQTIHEKGGAPIMRLSGSDALERLEALDGGCRSRLLGLRFRIETDPEVVAAFMLPTAARELRARTNYLPVLLVIVVVGFLLLFSGMFRGPDQNDVPATNFVVPELTPEQAERVKAAFAPFDAALQATLRRYARIELALTSDDEFWSSKIGGRPYLPKGAQLPLDPDHPGRPMALLAQIDFAELPAMDGYPRAGLLQFFVAEDPKLRHFGEFRGDRVAQQSRQTYFRVVFWPEQSSDLEQLPAQLPAPMSLMSGLVLRMRFSAAEESITPADSSFPQRVGVDPFELAERLAKELRVSEYAVAEAMPLAAGYGHKVGGWPDFAQDDPRGPDSNLQLLLQLDSDEYLMWGDAGVANFFIPAEDLARGDFSRVMFNWDSH